MPMIDLSEWQPPSCLDEREVQAWPRGVFPGPFERFSSELARSTETPLELATLMMLATVATVAHGHFVVRAKEDYSEPVNLWTCVAMPPGSRKSAVQGACTAPLAAWEREQRDFIVPKRQLCESMNQSIEARLKALRNKAANADEETFGTLTREIAKIEEEIEAVPSIPQLWTSDITPENLSVVMLEQEERMSILSDEGGILDILAGRYSGGVPNLDLVLKAHSGTGCRVNRGSRPPVFLERPCLTMGLTPQPGVLEGMARNKAFRGRGLIARFLYALPASNLGYRTLDEPSMDMGVSTSYQEAILSIIELSERLHPAGTDAQILGVSPAAYEHWHGFSRIVELRMREDGLYDQIKDWAGKLPGAVIRVAGLLHVMKSFDGQWREQMIDLDTMKSAVDIGLFLQSHALAVFDLMGGDPHRLGAGKVLRWLERERQQRFTRRECHYALKSYFKKVDDLKPCLEVLEEHGYIRARDSVAVAHRPSLAFDVNPHLYAAEEEED